MSKILEFFTKRNFGIPCVDLVKIILFYVRIFVQIPIELKDIIQLKSFFVG